MSSRRYITINEYSEIGFQETRRVFESIDTDTIDKTLQMRVSVAETADRLQCALNNIIQNDFVFASRQKSGGGDVKLYRHYIYRPVQRHRR